MEWRECPECCGNGQTIGKNSGDDIICPVCSGRGYIPAWQPIETAPKDGAEILCVARGDRDYYGVAQWAERDPDFPRSIAGWFWPYAIRPTHWMPLPSPPDAV